MSIAAERERGLRDQAVIDAKSLYAEHGPAAIDLLRHRLIDQSRDAEQRRCDRLTLLATERLDREHRQANGPTALVVWKPPLFSFAGLASLFGFARNRR